MRVTKINQGKGRGKSKKFYSVWDDARGQRHSVALFTSRKASKEAADNIQELIDLRAAKATLPADLSRWVEGMDPDMRDRLAKCGVIDAGIAAAGKPLAEHLDDWRAALLAKGNGERHAELVVSRCRKAFDGCKFVYWTDLVASTLMSHLSDLRKDRTLTKEKTIRGISAQTFNFYLQACRQFCRWMVRESRANQSPLTHLQGLNVKTDRRHDRRALLADELCRLLNAAHVGPERYGISGAGRAMLYRVAVETGLRAGELRSLTRASFILDGDEPSVTISAAYAKNRRQDTLPLRPTTAGMLEDFLSGKLPAAVAFNVPDRTAVARMFRADLEAAREKWLSEAPTPEERAKREQSNFLRYVDDAGHYADFHSLRHTFISNLATGGVHPKTAQQLARHSTIGLTMDRYSHTLRGQLADALDVLPTLPIPDVQEALATGTDGESVVLPVVQNRHFQGISVESGGVKGQGDGRSENVSNPKESADFREKSATEEEATFQSRTGNRRFTKPVLCQLS